MHTIYIYTYTEYMYVRRCFSYKSDRLKIRTREETGVLTPVVSLVFHSTGATPCGQVLSSTKISIHKNL